MSGFIGMFFGDPVSLIINGVIIALAAAIIIMMGKIKRKLCANEEGLISINNGKRMQRVIEADATMRVISGTSIDPKDMNELKKDYDRICVNFETVSQLIPIFPSLGILGTVAGLMLQIQAEGLEEMTDSIGLALSTTLLALLLTVILKVWATVSISRRINELDVNYRNYDRDRQDLVDQHILQEDK